MGWFGAWPLPNPYLSRSHTGSTLSFKQHAIYTKAKGNTRNNLLRKLINGRWGAHPATVRTTALALCFSTAEFACSSWGHSRHTGHVDIALNDTCRIITGCLKATPNTLLVCTGGNSPSPHTPKGCRQRCLQEDDRDTHSMTIALPSTGFHPEKAFLIQQKHLTHKNKMLAPHCG